MKSVSAILACVLLVSSATIAGKGTSYLQALSDEMTESMILNDTKKIGDAERKFYSLSPLEQAKVKEMLRQNPKAAKAFARSQVSDLVNAVLEYSKMQNSYVKSDGKLEKWQNIGFEAYPTDAFNFSEMLYGIKAISNIELAGCPAHSIWKVSVTQDKKSGKTSYQCSVSGSKAKACEDLTARALKNICK